MYMVMRSLRAALIGLALVLILGFGTAVLADNPSGSMDDGIYGNSDYQEYSAEESAHLIETNTDGGTESNSPVPEPGSIVLLTTGLAVLSGRYLRRR